jgi:hypothetical protein
MLAPNLLPKVVPHDGSGLLLGLIVRARGRLVEGFPPPNAPRKPGRPALLSESEVLTLAILAQWPRFRSERDFWRFASSHLRPYFPKLCSQSQFNRRVRTLEPELRALQKALAGDLCDPSAVYRVMDTTLIPAIVRVRASRKEFFCGQATFGRSASKTEWIYGFKVALVVDNDGVVTVFGLAQASSDERPIGEALLARDRHEVYLADKGFTGVEWERRWLEEYGASYSGRHLLRQLPAGMAEDRSPVGFWQAADHRRGDRAAQGFLLPGAPPGQDVERSADTSGGQDGGLHLRSTYKRHPRSASASPGGPVGLDSLHITRLSTCISACTIFG